jgi:putative aldouronate transport system permease protein
VEPTLKAYEMVFVHSPQVMRAVLNSAVYTVVGTAISLFLTSLLAYPLSRKHLPHKNLLITMVVITMFFNGGIIPNFLVVLKLGIMNTIWAVVLPNAIVAFYLIIMKTFFQGIPDSVEESAFIDGANDIQIFLRIFVPLSKAIFATLVIFYAVAHWNAFFIPMLYLHENSKYPIQVLLRNYVIEGNIDLLEYQVGMEDEVDYFLTGAVTIRYVIIMVSAIPIILVYPFLQRYFVKGALVGSIKG